MTVTANNRLSQQQPKTREHEIKFTFSSHHVESVVQWLRHRCRLDPDFPHNRVASIYYDTKDWQFLREKMNSDYLKTKFRVRWYQEPGEEKPPGQAFIEVKSKIGTPRTKFRMAAPYPASWFAKVPLEDLRLLDIPYSLKAQGILLKQHLFPVFIVQYERYRFVELVSGTRVCVDYNIGMPRVNRTMLPAANPFPLPTAVLEVKGNVESLPGILSYLLSFNCKKTSFSKYLACYEQLRQIY